MTIAKDFASKAVVAFVAAAMLFTMFAPSAKAQSTEDLQTMINTLLAQIAALQSQVGGSTGAGSTSSGSFCPYTWTRDLAAGAKGADVMKLQQFLNSDPDTRVSASGVGSMGMETEFYGPATGAAVSKFQVKYRAEILSPLGLVNPTGYFGAGTRDKMNSICSATVVPPVVVPPTDEDDEDTDEDMDAELSGEASLDNFEIDSASDDTIEEGNEDAEIAELTFEFTDGDASISRLDIAVLKDGVANTNTAQPWDAFDSFTLWVDGEMVSEINANDEDDYLNEDTGTLRFSGLDIVAMEDEELDVVIAASVQSNLDSAELTVWDVSVDAIRFFDADGVATTEDSGEDFGAEENFTVEVAGADDEVIVKTSTNDPDATTLQVKDDAKSDWYTVFAFDLDTDDSVNDIEFNEVAVTVNTSLAFGTLVDDYELVIDGVTIDKLVGSASTSVNGLVTDLRFDVDGDVVVDAGERVGAELRLRFNSLLLANEGATVQGVVTSGQADAIVAEGADDILAANLSGAATGDVHTLRTTGIDVEPKSESAVVTTSDGALNDYVTYKLTVDVTAFDQDAFIPIASASTSWSLVTSAGVAISPAPQTASTSVVITSTADVGGAGNAYFEINEGETESVTITVTFTPSIANTAAGLQLNSLLFDETGTATGADDKTWSATPATDYRTDVVTVVN